MPGLIDSHVHVVLSEVSIPRLENVPLTLMTARAAVLMRGMLDRGFTSVRDTGGADWGLKEATDKWLLPGPRLFIAGALGPTGGHSDGRRRTDLGTRCHCCDAMDFSMGARRRRRRGAPGRARGDAPGRRPGQDHDVGRRRLALRPARQPAVLARARWPPPSRRRTPSAATSAPTPTRSRPSRARRMPACAPSSTAT